MANIEVLPGNACAGIPPGETDDEGMDQRFIPRVHNIDQRSIEQHHHDHHTQQYVDQRSVYQHVHIEEESARHEAHEARVAALQIQAEAQRAVVGAEQAAQNIAMQANLEVRRVRDAANAEVTRVVGNANSENEVLRHQNAQQQQTIKSLQSQLHQQQSVMSRLQQQLDQLLTNQSRNSADHIHEVLSPIHTTPAQHSPMSSAGRPPRIPSPKAPSEVSNVSAELGAHMADAMKTLGQQIGKSMKSMQEQINHLVSSHMTRVPSHVGGTSRNIQVFAPGDPGGDDDDDDDDNSEEDDDGDDDDDRIVDAVGRRAGLWHSPGGGPPGGNGDPLYADFMPGGEFNGDEHEVYKGKDLSNLSIPSLPKDASAFRGWRNSLIAKLSSIDRTGQGVIMRCISTIQ